MVEKVSAREWVYVVVCNPDRKPTFLGLHDNDKEIDFIPVFETKEAANDCFLSLPREKGIKYEIQAVHVDELHEDARKNGFVIAMVDSNGNVVEKIL
ncbi:MAG: hypothetical protein V2I36_12800 [Desulfopila sp.]|jgi:hypothetical protein|nr:hypothetical protein [Desulfopila sp.]